MKTDTNHTLYHLIRDYMQSMGTSRTTVVALASYMDAIQRLRCAPCDFKAMLDKLNTVIKNTEPRVVPLVHLIEIFEQEMAAGGDLPLETARQRAVEILDRQMKRFEDDTARVTVNCMDLVADGDLIIAHSPSAYIREALVRAHTEQQRKFKVLVLKQDFTRTRDLIDALTRNGVDHLLIPEYNLSHYLKSMDKLFIGAVSVTPDHQVVAGIGTANVVSLCHWFHVPVYLFVESIKFAHRPLPDQHIYNEETAQTEADFTFHLKTFSHDFIDLQMVDHLITESGEVRAPAA